MILRRTLLLSLITLVHAALRGSDTSIAVDHPQGQFTPEACNANLDTVSCQRTWEDVYGDRTVFEETVVIPCGECLTWRGSSMPENDNSTRTIHEFRHGLVVHGKLWIPDGSPVHLRTTFVLVKGALQIDSTKPIDGTPDVSMTFVNTTSPIRALVDQEVCGANGYCAMGDRPFVVAGGKVTMNGLPSSDSMPTWLPVVQAKERSHWIVPLEEYTQYTPPPPFPSCKDELIALDFKKESPLDMSLEEWQDTTHIIRASFGTHLGSTHDSLRITKRRHVDQGFVLDLDAIRKCFVPNVTYIVTLKVVMTKFIGSGPETDCARFGTGCLILESSFLPSHHGAEEVKEQKWVEHPAEQFRYGEEVHIVTTMSFTEYEISRANVHHTLTLHGPGASVEMEVFGFSMTVPPPDVHPDPDGVCESLVPGNGDAELSSEWALPFETNHRLARLRVITEKNQNRYFEMTGRHTAHQEGHPEDRDPHISMSRPDELVHVGLTWSVPPSCMHAKSVYRFHADVRVHKSEKPTLLEWSIRGRRHDESVVYGVLVTCPPSNGDWVSCDGEYTVTDEMEEGGAMYHVVSETLGSAMVDYDVDNLSFELEEAPVDQLVLANSIENDWAPGAELVLASHDSNWAGRQYVRIEDVSKYDKNHVIVRLNRPIERPIIVKENPQYATEVALLSRNIAFFEGGHFTILHTPNVKQVIQGVDFVRFGQAGSRNHFPIQMDNCDDSKGSIISKNTIRHSQQRCLVLEATDNVMIEGNVAFDTAGHCFALTSGTETGNSFVDNLAMYTLTANTTLPVGDGEAEETDHTPASFWITNPENRLEGNVAAGSQGFGYWIQVEEETRGPHGGDTTTPRQTKDLVLERFLHNTAHSIKESPLRVTGYHPETLQVIEGFRSFHNTKEQFDLDSSENLHLENTLLDVPFRRPPHATLRNLTVAEIHDCHHATTSPAYFNQDIAPPDIAGNNGVEHHAIPSASSVFLLQGVVDS